MCVCICLDLCMLNTFSNPISQRQQDGLICSQLHTCMISMMGDSQRGVLMNIHPAFSSTTTQAFGRKEAQLTFGGFLIFFELGLVVISVVIVLLSLELNIGFPFSALVIAGRVSLVVSVQIHSLLMMIKRNIDKT